jgi:hypothetical protein
MVHSVSYLMRLSPRILLYSLEACRLGNGRLMAAVNLWSGSPIAELLSQNVGNYGRLAPRTARWALWTIGRLGARRTQKRQEILTRWERCTAEPSGCGLLRGRLGGTTQVSCRRTCRPRSGELRGGRWTPWGARTTGPGLEMRGAPGGLAPCGAGPLVTFASPLLLHRSWRPLRPARSATMVTWLILPVVICLSQRLSHACLSISNYTAKLRMAH